MGDVAIQYQVHRDLYEEDRSDLRSRIATEGWGKMYLDQRLANGHWGNKFYHPKWTSSHYTILDLKNLGICPDQPEIKETINRIATEEKGIDGGINSAGSVRFSDVCVNGMFLNYASYFNTDEHLLEPVIDFVLLQVMPDGGFNCRINRSGAWHSSLHSTISLLEGIEEYLRNGYTYRARELQKAKQSSIEFILIHQLFLSDRTGQIIHPDFLKFRFPCRWKYDIYRALDYFQDAGVPWDERMRPAISKLLDKSNRSKTWNMQAKHPGQIHFEMEKAGKPGRWNTLRALRILRKYQNSI